MVSPSSQNYTATAKALHWIIAVLVITLLGLGLFMTRGTQSLQLKFELYQLHKSLGITVLALMILRVFWRLFALPPAMPPHMPGWERAAAHGTHILLYTLLIAMPLSGWAMISAALPPFNFPTVLYKTIAWPHLPFIEELTLERKKTVEPALKTMHSALGWALGALVVLHIAAALRHGLFLKDGVMSRMLPRFLKTSRSVTLPLVLMVAFAVLSFPAAAQEWAINKQKSKLTFEAEAAGQTVTGQFQQFEAEIRFNRDHLDLAEIAARIDINTLSTGQGQVDDALRAAEWFDMQTYPSAGFRATAVKPGKGAGSYVMEGELAIKGRTQPVTMPFTMTVDQGEATVTGEATVNRQAFGLGPKGPVSGMTIGDTVKIRLDLIATRLDN
jgi:cytochrome b561/polyisoprenoid-binding protein YceI